MADLLKTGTEWLEQKRSAHMAQTVTYQRGSDFVEVSATVGRTLFQVEREGGIVEQWESRDFIVATADLVLSGLTVLPAVGDRILEVGGALQFTYQVLGPNPSEPPFRYSDSYRMALRIHTKLIATGAAP